MSNENKPHPHAELIKAWADGALIEYFDESLNDWKQCLFNQPTWDKDAKYRIKPEEPSDEPWKPEKGERYAYVQDTGRVCLDTLDNTYAHERLAFGNYFRTKEEAYTAAERVKAALKGEVVSKSEHERYAEQCRVSDKQSHDLECKLYDKIDRLTKCTELDGKPLTDGEKALIKALRNVKIRRVFPKDETMLCFGSVINRKNVIEASDLHIAFETTIFDGIDKDEAIIDALRMIKKEQEEQNEAE